MRALILNSGLGSRMGSLVSDHPKCMTEIAPQETILSRQLRSVKQVGVQAVVMTTGFLSNVLQDYCLSLDLDLDYTFVYNDKYERTNYIYSIYLAREYLQDSVLLLHGDLVFDEKVLIDLLRNSRSQMTINTTLPLPVKDFKAVVEQGKVTEIGVDLFDNAYAAQPLYKLNFTDWKVWLERIVSYCEEGQVTCYAENALNEVTDKCHIWPLDYKDKLCTEIDNPEDLRIVRDQLRVMAR